MSKEIPESTLEKVAEFHEAFDTPVRKHPTIPDEERRELRVELIREELEELEDAADIVEIADALVDLHYVVMGSAVEYGLQGIFRELFDEVHDSNMSKLDDEGNPIFREDGKVLKSENYRPPELAKIIFNDTNFIPEEDKSEITDKDRIDFLQKITEKSEVTGKVVMRDSTTGRGWRLHETDRNIGVPNVREAIDNYIEAITNR